jgi:hypothetical protein
MPAVHLVAPSVLHSSIGCGGTSLYRGVALACTTIGPTYCHELAHPDEPGDRPWRAPGVSVRRYPTIDDLLAALAEQTRAHDVIGKWLNAGGTRDAEVDIAVARMAADRDAACFYLDPEPFVRLPLIEHADHYLWDLLPAYAGVLLFAGGQRAIDEYSRRAGVPVWHLSAGLGALAHRAPASPERDIDLLITVARHSARERRLHDLLRRLDDQRPGSTVYVAGSLAPDLLRELPIKHLSPRDPDTLMDWYGRSRFALNLIRADFAGYSHTPAARVFEAARAGACLITDPFPGLADYLLPGTECLTDAGRLVDHLNLPEADRARIATRAGRRVNQSLPHERALLQEALATPPPAPTQAARHVAIARDRLDLRRRCQGARMALLPGVEQLRSTLLAQLRPERIDRVASAEAAVSAGYDVVALPASAKEEFDAADRDNPHHHRTVIVAPPADRSGCLRLVWGRDWLVPGTETPWV